MMNGGHGKLTYLCLDWPIEEIQSGEDKSNRLAEKAHIDIMNCRNYYIIMWITAISYLRESLNIPNEVRDV